MSEEGQPNLHVLAPPLSVTEEEAAKIFEDLNLITLERTDPGRKAGISVIKQLRLGAFGDDLGAVRLDRGAIMVAERVALNQLLRLNEKANEAKTAEELKAISYPIGYLIGQIAKAASISIKAKTIVEEVDKEKRRPRQESWQPGSVIEAPSVAKSVAG